MEQNQTVHLRLAAGVGAVDGQLSERSDDDAQNANLRDKSEWECINSSSTY